MKALKKQIKALEQKLASLGIIGDFEEETEETEETEPARLGEAVESVALSETTSDDE